MAKSAIQWTDFPWNPLRARFGGKVGWSCVKVSEGCAHCYAEQQNRTARFGGTGLNYTVRSDEKVEHFLDEKTLAQPLHWCKPRRVFVCSMTDLFGEWVTDEQIDRVFAVMALTPQHTFQVLTKRPERMRAYLASEVLRAPMAGIEEVADRMANGLRLRLPDPMPWPLPNVWLGTSVENQRCADERIPHVLATLAAVHFISVEPLLEAMNLRGYRDPVKRTNDANYLSPTLCVDEHGALYERPALDWVVAGGESGPHARPFDLGWARSLRDQCAAAGVPFFMKQVGARVLGPDNPPVLRRWILADGERTGEWVPLIIGRNAGVRPENAIGWVSANTHGADPAEWPDDLRKREFPLARRHPGGPSA